MPLYSPGFLARKRPKKHRLLEDAERLDVVYVLFELGDDARRTLREWQPPLHRGVVLVRGRRGAIAPYWHFRCPCGRRVEALYRPAGEREWKCRTCHSLIYASHRHGLRHPSRRKPPKYRERVSLLRAAKRQERRSEAHRRRREREAARMKPPGRPPQPLATAPVQLDEGFAGIRLIAGRPEKARWVTRAEVEAEAHVRERFDAAVEQSAHFILAHSPSPRDRKRAGAYLDEQAQRRAPRVVVAADPTPAPVVPLSPDEMARVLSPAIVARLNAGMAECDAAESTQPAPPSGPAAHGDRLPPRPPMSQRDTADELRDTAQAVFERLAQLRARFG